MDYNDNFGTPQQYMARFGVKKSTFYMQVRRDIIVFTKRGMVDFGASQRNLRAAGRPLKSNARKRIKVGWTVCHDEWVELNQIHRKYQKKRHLVTINCGQ